MMKKLQKLWEYRRLGLANLWHVGWYRLRLKYGLHPVQRLKAERQPEGPFFNAKHVKQRNLPGTAIWSDHYWAFGYPLKTTSLDNPPNWHQHILNGNIVSNPDLRWDKINTFSEDLGDIKAVWEASRFDWALAFAQRAASGDDAALKRLESWLTDWSRHNPAYHGPNWMCGQETSIRLCHILLCAHILGQADPDSPSLRAFVINHLRRIAPTTAYAKGQDNNHATSEAMALIVGGLWLRDHAHEYASEAQQYIDKGYALMEHSVRHLIFDDGGFAQYSTTYHRVMLDSLSITEWFRHIHAGAPFSDVFYRKARKAADWLKIMIVGSDGEVPNWGSNDGAMLLPLGCGQFSDFRPSAALAATIFKNETPFAEDESVQSLLGWLNLTIINTDDGRSDENARIFMMRDSGLAIRKWKGNALFFRLPGYRFRPHQCDGLHIDLWLQGKNLLIDSGTYSYSEGHKNNLTSTKAHNSVMIDNVEQMPRISRFLYGNWSKRKTVQISEDYMSADMTNYRDMRITREIFWKSDNHIRIVDTPYNKTHLLTTFWHIGQDIEKSRDDVYQGSNFSISHSAEATSELSQQTHSVHYLRLEYHDRIALFSQDQASVLTEIKF